LSSALSDGDVSRRRLLLAAMRLALPFYVAQSDDLTTLRKCCVSVFKFALDDADAMHTATSFVHRVAQLAQSSGDEEFAAATIETVVELHSLLVSHSQFMGMLLPEHESNVSLTTPTTTRRARACT
jgi:hypothetical protein